MNDKPTAAQRRGVGMGIDAQGGPVIDPTANVLQLVEAAIARQDDLRLETNKRIDSEISCIKELATLQFTHSREMAAADSKRLDAIRQVDVLAVNTSAERSAQAVAALAATTSANAENLRTALNNTAATIATQLTNTVDAITKRIAALEQSFYEGKGRQTVVDPQMERLTALVEALARTQATGAGKSEGFSASWGFLLGAVSLVAALTLMATKLMGH